MATKQALLTVQDLAVSFPSATGRVKAVDGVSFELQEGSILGIVGESGCGKTATALSILRLVPRPGQIVGGKISFRGENILTKSEEEMRELRGKQIGLVFQDPMSSLNPSIRVGDQVAEALLMHEAVSKESARESVIQMMKQVGIPSPERRFHAFPHELSGGLRQRVMIAMALICRPSLLIADEPTTALDVTIQAQILDLLMQLKTLYKLSVILVSHNLAVIAQVADTCAVMYAGRIVEHGRVADVFTKPTHPYTQALIDSIPDVDEKRRLKPIEGSVPNLARVPSGCAFHPRCPRRMDICDKLVPDAYDVGDNHYSRCFIYGGGKPN